MTLQDRASEGGGPSEDAARLRNLAHSEAPRLSVLVVDDDPDHRELISRRLAVSGLRVTTAATGDAALAKLRGEQGPSGPQSGKQGPSGPQSGENSIDLVLLDYRLAGRDGITVLRQIRRLAQPPAVVMVTGMGSEEIAIACIREGASDYIVKDAHYLSTLPTVVERAWRHHDLERRAGELERLALVVTSAPARDIALHEIVEGARWLLAADRCELQLSDADASDELPAHTGELPADAMAIEELRVPVSLPETGRLGELLVQRVAPRPFTDEERRLAATFATFAAIAMSKLRQLELERSLVAELERTLDLRRQLVAGVSHELRTPLTAISGFAQTMLTHWDRLSDVERKDMVGRIRTNSKDLTALVEQLLDLATVEAGKLRADVQPIDIEQVVREVLADLSPLLTDRTVVVDVPDGLAARADAMIVRRLLYNLVTNAVKYTPADAAIAVRASVVERGGGVRIDVADTGRGLSPEDAARVFEPFWRGESTRRAQRGTGIGLSLVRDYARVMGGEAGLQTAPGEGATFWFTLPR